MAITITNPNSRPVVTAQQSGIGEDGVSIAIDYTTYYDRIATALETMATNSTTMATNSTTMATNITTIASKLTAIETYQKKLKELGEGSGIRVIGPYEVFGMISIYRLLIEQAKILDSAESASASQIQAALSEVTRLSERIKNNIPKDF